MKNLSPYKITWVILTPIKGKATKKDLTAFFSAGVYTYCKRIDFNEVTAYFPTKEKALKTLKKVKNLSKNYEVILITDKQIGMVNWEESFKTVATKKQLQDRFFI